MIETKYSLMKESKEESHDNNDGPGVGRDNRFDLSRSLCLVPYFWGKVTTDVCQLNHTYLSLQHSHKLTRMLQELPGAFGGEEGILQTSEIELQHACHRVQVVSLLSQGILSYRGSTRPHIITANTVKGRHSTRVHVDQRRQKNTLPHLSQMHLSGCWSPSETQAL